MLLIIQMRFRYSLKIAVLLVTITVLAAIPIFEYWRITSAFKHFDELGYELEMDDHLPEKNLLMYGLTLLGCPPAHKVVKIGPDENRDEDLLDPTGDLRHLSAFQNLRVLEINWLVDDRSLFQMPELPALRVLVFAGEEGLTNVGLNELKRFSNLEELWLECHYSKIDLEFLVHFKKLRILGLWSRLAGPELQSLFEMSELEELYLVECPSAASGLRYLPQLPMLNKLSLSKISDGEGGLSALAKFPNLETISFYSGSFTGTTWEELSHIPSLRSLDLHNCVDDTSIPHFSELTYVKSIEISGGRNSPELWIAAFPDVTNLVIDDYTIISDGEVTDGYRSTLKSR